MGSDGQREAHSNLIRYYFFFHRKPVIPTEGNRCYGCNFQLNIASPSLQRLACTNSRKKGAIRSPHHLLMLSTFGTLITSATVYYHPTKTKLCICTALPPNRRNTIRSRARIRHGVGTSKKGISRPTLHPRRRRSSSLYVASQLSA